MKSVRVSLNGNDYTVNIYPSNLETIFKWFHDHRKPARVYVPNKQKHGSGGKGAWNYSRGFVVGKMLCDTEEEAQDLLDFAIGKTWDTKKMFSYDVKRAKYVQFMSGGSDPRHNNSLAYHGFHIRDVDFRPKDKAIKSKLDMIDWNSL